MEQIRRAYQELSQDHAFCQGFRQGVGLILASFVIIQCLICAIYPLLFRN